MPLFVRDGARLPRIDVDTGVRNTDDLLERAWTLHIYGDGDRHIDDPRLEGFDGNPLDPVAVVHHGPR